MGLFWDPPSRGNYHMESQMDSAISNETQTSRLFGVLSGFMLDNKGTLDPIITI